MLALALDMRIANILATRLNRIDKRGSPALNLFSLKIMAHFIIHFNAHTSSTKNYLNPLTPNWRETFHP
jgi:hypothetical protein